MSLLHLLANSFYGQQIMQGTDVLKWDLPLSQQSGYDAHDRISTAALRLAAAMPCIDTGKRLAMQLALDGQIISGEANVSTENITGEAVPTRRGPGDELPSGARAEDGALVVKAMRPASESTIARIAQLSRQAKACCCLPAILTQDVASGCFVLACGLSSRCAVRAV